MKTDAKAKALVLTQLMRIAANEGCSPTAQALLAIIIAEAWPDKREWIARLGYPVLEHRLGVARNTIRRAAHELELADLVRFRPGRGQKISMWQLARLNLEQRLERGHQRPLRGVMGDPSRGQMSTGEGSPATPLRGHGRPLIQDNKIYSGAT